MVSQTQHVALELHALIRQIDPARWAETDIAKLREGLSKACAKLDDIQAEEKIGEAIASLRENLLRIPDDESATVWITFRETLSPHYGALAAALKSNNLSVPDLRPTNWQRSFFHALSGVLAFLAIQYLPFVWVELIAISASIFAWSLEITRTFSERWNQTLMTLFSKVSHSHEAYRINSSTWYTTAMVILVLIGSPIIAKLAVLILAFCDPIAATVGRKFGKRKIINNRSLEGTGAFFLSGVLISAFVFFVSTTTLSLGMQIAFIIIAPLSGAIVELLSRDMDDNFSIPVGVAIPLWILLSLF